MKKENGFTLIEVIIALAIMASVVLIGYQVINKTHGLSEEQALTANVQNGVNNLKVYITKELSSAKDVELSYENNKGGNIDDIEKRKEDYMNISDQISNLSIGKKFIYKYILHLNEKDLVEYEIEVHKDKGRYVFNIKRTDRNVKMNLIENQPLTNNLIPMKINIKNDNIYDVELNYIKQKTKIYSFDVYSRLNDKSTDEPGTAYNYLAYCSQRIDKSFKEAKKNSNPGFDNKLNEAILNSVNGFIDIDKENPKSNLPEIKQLLFNMESGLKNIKGLNSNQITRILNQLNELEYYMKAAQVTVKYLEENEYILNTQADLQAVHTYTQSYIVTELQKSRDKIKDLQNYNEIHVGILGDEMLKIQEMINLEVANFYSNKDPIEQYKKIANRINDLIDRIIETQVKIKDIIVSNNKPKSKHKGNDKPNLNNNDLWEALGHLDNVKDGLINVKYMLNQTNHYQQ